VDCCVFQSYRKMCVCVYVCVSGVDWCVSAVVVVLSPLNACRRFL